MTNIDIAIGARIRELRQSQGMSQGLLVRELGKRGFGNFFQTTLSRIESGDRPVRLSEAVTLADIFAVTLAFLVGSADPAEREVRDAGFRAGVQAAHDALDGLIDGCRDGRETPVLVAPGAKWGAS